MFSSTTEQMISHLEFLGYQTERVEKNVIEKHQKNVNILLQELKGGVLFSSFFDTQEAAKRDMAEYLTWINDLNRRTLLLRFYANADFDKLIMESWYPSLYDKSNFGLFMDLFNGNIALLFTDEKEAKKFLK